MSIIPKDPQSLFMATFFGGMLAEVVLLLALTVRKEYKRLFGLAVLIAVIYPLSVLASMGSGDYTIQLVSSCFLVFGATALFLPEILPVITRYHVLSYTITFWYTMACAKFDNFMDFVGPVFLVASFAGAAGAIIGHFRSERSGSMVWNLAYAWYLMALGYIGVFQMGSFDLGFFSPWDGKTPLPGPASAIVYGMAFTYVSISFAMIYFYVMAGFNQCTSSRVQDKERLMIFIKGLLASKTQEVSLKDPADMIALLGVQGALAAANYFFPIVPHLLLVNCFVLVMPHLLNLLTKETR